jgi:hypothetical protein
MEEVTTYKIQITSKLSNRWCDYGFKRDVESIDSIKDQFLNILESYPPSWQFRIIKTVTTSTPIMESVGKQKELES